MKKFLSVFILLLVLVPLFASLTIEGDLPTEYMENLRGALEENLRGRYEGDVIAVVGLEEGTGFVTLSLSLGEKVLSTKVAPGYIGEEVEAMLSYEELLFAPQPRLDYIYGSSYSALLPESMARGTLLMAKDMEGKARGIFAVSKEYGEATLLHPEAVMDPKPGLGLEEISPMRIRSAFWYKINGGRALLDVSLSYSTITYPVVPYVSLAVAMGSNPGVGLGLGGEISFSLASLWSKAPEFITRTSLVGSVEGDLWIEGNGARFDGRYALMLEHMVGGNFTFRLGAGELGYNSLAVTLGGGMRIL